LEKVELASVYLPHLQFAHLGEHYPEFFKETFHLGKVLERSANNQG
jgi:hypothetical protein